ncbi:carboxypeptidase regulatory-like domain-containing protein [bacterium]|nr:carboxypeptidase regulatory-like domain-containing protein [bacterium]
MNRYFLTTLICLILIANVAYGAIIPVPPGTIQEAIDVAEDGDTVLVADGVYTGDGNKNLDFKGKTITVTSENGAENCIIDCEDDGRGFYFHSGETEASVVSGFTIRNGYIDGRGGGIYCDNSSPTINDNIIKSNVLANINEHGYGAGIYCIYASPIITNNMVMDNSAGYYGGGIDCHMSSPIITNNTISGNTATYGGGIALYYSDPSIINNIISRNSAGNWGGGIFCQYEEANPTIINNTITENSADEGGGILCAYGCSPTIMNTILWNDSPEEIYLLEDASITVTYSDIQGGWPGEGNIDANPLFVDPENGDYHLQAGSPCINAGTPEGAPPDDIEGNPRDEFPDMGAYEYQKVGTGSINGTVTDGAGNPIKFALVIAVLGETKIKAFTDSEGNYEITDLEPGIYWVLCIKKGYKVGIRKAEVVAGEETTVNFRLRPKPE